METLFPNNSSCRHILFLQPVILWLEKSYQGILDDCEELVEKRVDEGERRKAIYRKLRERYDPRYDNQLNLEKKLHAHDAKEFLSCIMDFEDTVVEAS